MWFYIQDLSIGKEVEFAARMLSSYRSHLDEYPGNVIPSTSPDRQRHGRKGEPPGLR